MKTVSLPSTIRVKVLPEWEQSCVRGNPGGCLATFALWMWSDENPDLYLTHVKVEQYSASHKHAGKWYVRFNYDGRTYTWLEPRSVVRLAQAFDRGEELTKPTTFTLSLDDATVSNIKVRTPAKNVKQAKRRATKTKTWYVSTAKSGRNAGKYFSSRATAKTAGASKVEPFIGTENQVKKEYGADMKRGYPKDNGAISERRRNYQDMQRQTTA